MIPRLWSVVGRIHERTARNPFGRCRNIVRKNELRLFPPRKTISDPNEVTEIYVSETWLEIPAFLLSLFLFFLADHLRNKKTSEDTASAAVMFSKKVSSIVVPDKESSCFEGKPASFVTVCKHCSLSVDELGVVLYDGILHASLLIFLFYFIFLNERPSWNWSYISLIESTACGKSRRSGRVLISEKQATPLFLRDRGTSYSYAHPMLCRARNAHVSAINESSPHYDKNK